MKVTRKIIEIDDDRCDGCGNCVIACAEGALTIIDGKAKVISDNLCDGLGACLGHCPEDAITVETREAEPYDERRVMANVITQGSKVVRAHLDHLRDHGATAYLEERGIAVPEAQPATPCGGGCPGSHP